MLTVFGIRHHGAGSASSLRNALKELKPDCILIEGPPDADALIEYVANESLIPPIALLVYNPANLKQAAYYPFAHFSPEWQAMNYGVEKNIPTSFMDLPRTLAFSLDQKNKKDQQKIIHFEDLAKATTSKEEQKIAKDPLGYIAKIAGYDDGERWWDITFERASNPSEIFQSILSLMGELRTSINHNSLRELQREAYMRTTIRAAEKKGYQNIAVICGAWHAPVLTQYKSYKATSDKQFLKGIKKIKTRTTWVPWTYKRISKQSGYGAGIISPAWYELLFDKSEEVTIHWMSKVAQLLRAEDLPASAAHVIEAVRLANSLAAMRNLSVAGINELKEAAIAILCEGEASPMQLIEEKLIIGDKMGEVPDEIPVVPLQQDLNQCVKSARLSKEKNTLASVEKKLDLRVSSNLLASQLLHRLNILGIPWGEQLDGSLHAKGSSRETWLLEWEPDFAIRIIEAGMWGNTVYEAATKYILDHKTKRTTLAGLTQLVEAALNAGLKDAIPELTNELTNQSALTKDIFKLMEALPTLVNIIRYGSSKQINLTAVTTVIDQIIPRIVIGLPSTCINIDEETATDIFKKILIVNRAIHTLNERKYILIWYDALEKIMGMTVNGLIVGLSTRILFDKNVIDTEIASTYMHLSLSKGSQSLFAAQWIEGFLNGSGLFLIHHEQLWKIMDDWIDQLAEERFMEILPVLRRTFSKFSHPERQKMMDLAKKGKLELVSKKESDAPNINSERAKKVLPILKLLLDL